MKCRLLFAVSAMFLLTGTRTVAQQDVSTSSADVAYWVAYWARPRVVMYGPEEEAFNQNMHDVLFPWNDHDEPSNLGVLDDNARWLKNHPRDRFYIEGYASSRGDLIYNLMLSQRRADWVKQALISKGISEDRIAIAVGWGELYPVCPEANDECWARNRLVRFSYSPN